MSKTNPFDFVESINTTKVDLMKGTENDQLAEKSYVPYITNMALSFFPDTVLYANYMNGNYHLDNRLQYSFLINIVRSKVRRRKGKWKKEEDSVLSAVSSLYGYSIPKAKAALQVLSPEQIRTITKLKGDMI